MENRYTNWLHASNLRNTKRKVWKEFVRIMAAVVVFCTTYALILPAITLEDTYDCGMEQHQHTTDCYSQDDSTELICTLVEHVHTDLCFSNSDADVETAEDWEATLNHVELTGIWADDLVAIAQTQIGYTESILNYQAEENGQVRNGYTRYGAWYGIPYGTWDAMFVSFCLNYAQIPEEAIVHDSDPANWAATLATLGLMADPAEYTPAVGDLIFFTDGETVTRVGIVSELEMANDPLTGAEILESVKTIQGDVDGEVAVQRIGAADGNIFGYCSMQQAMKRFALLYPEQAYGVSLMADSDPELLIAFGDDTDTVTYTISKKQNLSANDPADGVLTGQISGANARSYIRFTISTDTPYTIQTGDVLTVRLKMSNVSGDLGVLCPCVQIHNESGFEITEIMQDFTLDLSGEYATYTITDLSALVGGSVNFIDIRWNDPASGATATFTVDYVSICHQHSYTASYTVTAPTCTTAGSVTYSCACGDSYTETADIDTVLSYASQLREANTRDDYSGGQFTWDTESKSRSWTYYNGVMLDAFMKVGTQEMVDYVVAFYDDVLDSDGTPIGYNTGEVDSVPMALALFDLLGAQDEIRNKQYANAIEYVFDQLWNNQTVLGDEYGGNFLHKSSWTTYQFGLDGIYMALPFLMEYANALDKGLLTNDSVTSAQIYEEIYDRLNWVAQTMYDETTGLYHHGWDGTNGNGVFWGRGIGWYAVALVDIIDMMPTEYQTQLTANLTKLFDGMLQYQDAETGMWYNVINYDGTLSYSVTEDDVTTTNYNKLETSVSSMMAYAMMKAYREGFVTDAEYYEAGQRAFNGTVENKMTGTAGNYSVVDTYKSSSVCTTPEEYLQNPYTTDEAKGVGALIMAAAADHSFGSWTVTQEATTEQAGVLTRKCSVCGATQTRTTTIIGWEFTVVDPEDLQDGEVYAVYANPEDENYVFLFSDTSNPNAKRVVTTDYNSDGYGTAPLTIGGTWYVPVSVLGDNTDAFTWKAETTMPLDSNGNAYLGNLLLQAQGFYTTTPGDRYLSVRDASNRDVQTYLKDGDSGRPQYVSLTIAPNTETADVDADCTIVNENRKNFYLSLVTDGGDDWKVSSETDDTPIAATPMIFAKVTPVYEEVKEPEEESYIFQVLGIDGPVEGKKYVLYYVEEDDNGSLTNNIKFLLSNSGCTSHGVNGVSTVDTLHTGGAQWTLNESDLGDHALAELQWTVEKVGDEWLLRSVSDPTLYLKLVCTDTSGSSKVGATSYDEQGARYFALTLTSSGDNADSWYTATSTEGENQLYFFRLQNKWNAITQEYEQSNSPHFYFAEVIEEEDDEEEDDSNTTEPSEPEGTTKVVGYTFTTLDPSTLYDGQIVSIYCRPDSSDTDTYTFAYSERNFNGVTVADTLHDSAPTTIGEQWDLTTDQMGESVAAFTWQVVKSEDGVIQLRLLGDTSKDYYLRMSGSGGLYYGAGIDNGNNTLSAVTTENEAGCLLKHSTKKLYLTYNTETGMWEKVDEEGAATTIYFASVSEKTEIVYPPAEGTNYPQAVETGSPQVDTLRFYNFVESGGEYISALPGCTFVIKGVSNPNYTYTIVSSDNPELHLPSDIPVGTYTIEEVSAPDGYLRDVDSVRSFEITINGDGQKVFAGSNTIGKFLNHANSLLSTDKTAEVEDYNNRTYQIMLSAESNLRLYEMDPVDVIFVVDQSNSMLFPAGLESTGSSVTIYKNDGCTYADENPNNATSVALDQLVAEGKLSKDQVYYIIADEEVTSTVYAIWFNGVDWMYQDASYYAKAYHANAEGYRQDDELAIFPVVAAGSEQPTTQVITENGEEVTVKVKANGGSLSYAIGGITLSKDIAATQTTTTATVNEDGEEVITTENVGTQKTYTLYTATNGYNRLHYLQDSLAHAIYQLADANSESTVTLIRFAKDTYHDECVGPLQLTPDNVQTLIEAVDQIDTDGGTRQDIALEHTYAHLTGGTITVMTETTDENGETVEVETTVDLEDKYTKGPLYTFTVLITDGAPVLSSGATHELGNADSAESTADDGTVYGRIKGFGAKVREESILMTIGLGMGAVEGGSKVLEAIATEPVAINHMILNDAAQLMNALKQLLFSSMVPREKVDLMGDITDVISDSFYPIAYVDKGQGAATGRQVLYSDDIYDWILLEPGDWITIEGEYVGTEQGNAGAGQLTKDANGDFCITWDDQLIYDCGLAWVPQGDSLPEGKTLIMVDSEGRQWFKLDIGDYVYAHGEYCDYSNQKTGEIEYTFVEAGTMYSVAGQYVLSDGADRPHIQWLGDSYYDIDFDASFQPYLWYGKFYVKAKEDFIGGNAIDTNKFAQAQAQENDGDGKDEFIGTIIHETPTVNVHLLDMNEMYSEVTVYLGDQINADGNSPLNSLKHFYENTKFTKLISDGGDVLNMYNVGDENADGLETDVFYLGYAMGRDLTTDEWEMLISGGTVTMEYTYDNASSHGPVGYFTFQLTKNGDTADFAAHEATTACDKQHEHSGCTEPVESYILSVTYTAYELGESGRPETNVHNGTAGPGTEVGGDDAGSTLETGYGTVAKNNAHEVHVISGKIEITKEIAAGLVSDEDQIFTFTIQRKEDGEELTLEVEVKAGQTTGVASISNLKRGTYVVTEAASDFYSIKEIKVLDSTNCYSEPAVGATGTTLLFHMGYDTDNTNVIDYAGDADYTSYAGAPDGVYGAALVVNDKTIYTAEVPVMKIWADGGDHSADAVYLVLMDNGSAVTVNGEIQYLVLSAANDWQGTFTVYLSGPGDSVGQHNYSVREVTVIDKAKYDSLTEMKQADYVELGELYALMGEDEIFVTVGTTSYVVTYGTDGNTLTVTNHLAPELPASGGKGTFVFTIGGWLLMAVSLMYCGYSQCRKRGRKVNHEVVQP